VNALHVSLPGRDFHPESPFWTPEWLTAYPRASSLKSQASKAKIVPGSCLFKFAHCGGGSLLLLDTAVSVKVTVSAWATVEKNTANSARVIMKTLFMVRPLLTSEAVTNSPRPELL
jgi:hypothetical protein